MEYLSISFEQGTGPRYCVPDMLPRLKGGGGDLYIQDLTNLALKSTNSAISYSDQRTASECKKHCWLYRWGNKRQRLSKPANGPDEVKTDMAEGVQKKCRSRQVFLQAQFGEGQDDRQLSAERSGQGEDIATQRLESKS